MAARNQKATPNRDAIVSMCDTCVVVREESVTLRLAWLFLAGLTACQSRPSSEWEHAQASRAVAPTPPVPSSVPADDGPGCGLPLDLWARGYLRMLPDLRPGRPPAAEPGSVTIVVLPDTQYYVGCRSRHLRDQVDYVLSELEPRNIRLVLTVGDLTDHNTDAEWAFFHDAVTPLLERVPLVLTTGNHDHGENGAALARGSGLLRAFGEPPARARALLASVPRDGNWENAYYRLPLGKSTLGLLTLEWGPRRSVVKWAAEVLAAHPDDRVVFSTHAYLYHDDTRYDWERFGSAQEWSPRSYGMARLDPADVYDGEMLWQELLRTHAGLWLTCSGHVLFDGEGYLASRGTHGNQVHQMLVNFQMLKNGGSGFLRLLEISPDGRSLQVLTYSPSLDQTAFGPRERFQVRLEPPLSL